MVEIIDNENQKALTTLARMKIFIGLTHTDRQDSLLTLLMNQTLGFIERYVGRNLLSQDYINEEYDGKGSQELVLRNFPVTTFTQLQVNENADNTDNWATISSDRYFAEDDGRIRLASSRGSFLSTDAGNFIEGRNKYRVTYVAGYLIDFANENDPDLHTLPQELEYACQKLVAGIFNTRKGEGISSEKAGDQSVTFNKLLFDSPELKAILDKYIRPIF